ncbi:YvrJ family protein [Moorella sulfitireducens]|uniref:YvrJ family protein n=1 Tax=Neomoorella sulfitireducens TaxID=2972948 RepID=UPI003BF55168
MEEMLKLAANYGFPMVIAFYVLARLEPVIKELQKSVTVLTVVVARQGGVDYEEARKLVEGNGFVK